MPFQARRCDGCGEFDYVECVEGYWLCRHCRASLEEDGRIELRSGAILKRRKA